MTIRTHDTIPFLMFRALAQITKVAHADFKELDLTVMSGRVMTIMALNKSPTVGELAAAASIDQSTLSHILKNLQKRGFMAKERQSSDNRSVRIVLTADGKELASTCLRAARKREKLFLKAIAPKDAVTFKRLLSEISENFEDGIRSSRPNPLDGLLHTGKSS